MDPFVEVPINLQGLAIGDGLCDPETVSIKLDGWLNKMQFYLIIILFSIYSALEANSNVWLHWLWQLW